MTISNIPTATSSYVFNQYPERPEWYESLWQAAKKGNLDEIKSMIKQSNIKLANFPSEFAGCFKIAAKEGHKSIIDFFLSLNVMKIIGLKHFVFGLNAGLEQVPLLESHREIISSVINFIKLEHKNSGFMRGYHLSEIFKAAFAYRQIKIVEAIAKSIEPWFLYEVLQSTLEKEQIVFGREEEYCICIGCYEDLIKATIDSLTPEISWTIINNYASRIDSSKVLEAITKSMDPWFLYNAFKSTLEEKNYAKEQVSLEFYKNRIECIERTISSLTPELSYEVLKAALNDDHAELVMTIIKSRPLEKLQLAFNQ